jgi:hypothetical protein
MTAKAVASHAPLIQNLFEVSDVEPFTQAEPEVEVLREAERLAIPSGRRDCFLASQDRTMHGGASEREEVPPDVACPDWSSQPTDDHARFVDDVGPGTHHSDSRVRVEKDRLTFQPLRMGDVIGILPRDVLPSRRQKTLIQGSGLTLALLAKYDEPVLSALESLEDFGRSVRRPIIDNDQLKVA